MKSNLFLSRYLAIVSISCIFISCKGDEKLTDSELIEKNVRAFFFMGDTVDVDVTVTDTIFDTEIAEMLATVDENKRLVQMDIDTLGIIIDAQAYEMLALESKTALASTDLDSQQLRNELNIKWLENRLKLKDLEFQKALFDQTGRILLHLKRSIWANIAGFEATVHYELGEEVNDLEILMDANYTVVD